MPTSVLDNNNFKVIYGKMLAGGLEQERRADASVSCTDPVNGDANTCIDKIVDTAVRAGWNLVDPYPWVPSGKTSLDAAIKTGFGLTLAAYQSLAGPGSAPAFLDPETIGRLPFTVQDPFTIMLDVIDTDMAPPSPLYSMFPSMWPWYVQLVDTPTGLATIYQVLYIIKSTDPIIGLSGFDPPIISGDVRWWARKYFGDVPTATDNVVTQIRGITASAAPGVPGWYPPTPFWYSDHYGTVRRAQTAHIGVDTSPTVVIGPSNDSAPGRMIGWDTTAGSIPGAAAELQGELMEHWKWGPSVAEVSAGLFFGTFIASATLGFLNDSGDPDGTADFSGTQGNCGPLFMPFTVGGFHTAVPPDHTFAGGGWLIQSQELNGASICVAVALEGFGNIRLSFIKPVGSTSAPGPGVMRRANAFFHGQISNSPAYTLQGAFRSAPNRSLYNIFANPHQLIVADINNSADVNGVGNSIAMFITHPTDAQQAGNFNGAVVVVGPGMLLNSLTWVGAPVSVAINQLGAVSDFSTSNLGGTATCGLLSSLFPFSAPFLDSQKRAIVENAWVTAASANGEEARIVGRLSDAIIVTEDFPFVAADASSGGVAFDGHVWVKVSSQFSPGPACSLWICKG